MDFLPPELEKYVEAHSQPEPELLRELNRETQAKVLQPRMLCGHIQGRVLSMLSKLVQPENILEIGTYTGYSALCLAEGLRENGKLHTIDINEELYDMQRGYFDRSPYGDKIIQHTGNALDIIPGLNMIFDLVFIDADKENYARYFELVLPRLRQGGIILSDNVLWSGKVLEKPKKGDGETAALIEYNKLLSTHPGVTSVLLPIRDGVMVSRKV